MKNDLIPTHCPSCGNELKIDGIHLVCNNEYCKEQKILKIVHWCETLEMEFFSESSIRTLYEKSVIYDVRDLYELKKDDFSGIEGFGDKKINNALEQIDKTKEMSIAKFCDALGIEQIGEKAIDKLGIKNEEELFSFSDSTYVIGQKLIDYMKKNKSFVKELLSVIKIKKSKEIAMGAKRIAMTGKGPKTRNELIADIEANGDVFDDGVKKDTQILLCEDVTGNSSKLQKAQKLGITLMSYDDYFKS